MVAIDMPFPKNCSECPMNTEDLYVGSGCRLAPHIMECRKLNMNARPDWCNLRYFSSDQDSTNEFNFVPDLAKTISAIKEWIDDPYADDYPLGLMQDALELLENQAKQQAGDGNVP